MSLNHVKEFCTDTDMSEGGHLFMIHYVMNELCEQLNIPCYEKNIELYDIYNADEAFMTGTPFCMLPVTSINNLPINNKNIGNIFKKLW